MCRIPREWASFIIQTLEVASNQSEFIVKMCHTLMVVLNDEPIDVGILIVENVKFMVNAPQQSCGNFCVINEVCWLARVLTQSDNVIIILMAPIRKITMGRLPAYSINEGGLDEVKQEEQDQFYHPKINKLEGVPQQQQQPVDRL